MTVSFRELAAGRVLDVAGDVDLGTSPDLRRALFDSLRETPRLAVNLRALRYIDSSGIATLIEALKDAQRLGKEFVLFGLSPAVKNVFHLTHVHRIFLIFDTEEEAMTAA
jgi:anti-sigma B factor antagonist